MRPLSVAVALLLLALVPASFTAEASWRDRASTDAGAAFTQVDTEAELVIGREVAAHLLGRYRLSADEKLQRYVNLVGGSLVQSCSRPDLEFHFAVVDSAEINGYSTPGGYVFVTTAALSAMENEAELAGLLAHEISHVAERHVVKELNVRGVEKSAYTTLATLLGGSSETASIAFVQSVDFAVEMILKDGYRKEDELQADAQAVLLCAFAGYDPNALVSFLERVGKIKTEVGKSYPHFDQRLRNIRQKIAEEGIQGESFGRNQERFALLKPVKKEGFKLPELPKFPSLPKIPLP